jgi:hypothetical protein
MDKVDRGQAIQEMMRSRGWKYFESEIKNKIEGYKGSLLSGGFTNIDEYNLEHSQYRAWKEVLDIPKKWIKKKNELLDKDNN